MMIGLHVWTNSSAQEKTIFFDNTITSPFDISKMGWCRLGNEDDKGQDKNKEADCMKSASLFLFSYDYFNSGKKNAISISPFSTESEPCVVLTPIEVP